MLPRSTNSLHDSVRAENEIHEWASTIKRPRTDACGLAHFFQQLILAGMRYTGYFEMISGRIVQTLDGRGIPEGPGLYTLVASVAVAGDWRPATRWLNYFGSSKSLPKRLSQYRQPSSKGHYAYLNLEEALRKGERIELWTLGIPVTEHRCWRGLPISLHFGIEAEGLAEYKPPWNRSGTEGALAAHAARRAGRGAEGGLFFSQEFSGAVGHPMTSLATLPHK